MVKQVLFVDKVFCRLHCQIIYFSVRLKNHQQLDVRIYHTRGNYNHTSYSDLYRDFMLKTKLENSSFQILYLWIFAIFLSQPPPVGSHAFRGKFDVPATVEFESLLTWQPSHGQSCKEGIGCTNIGGDERGRAGQFVLVGDLAYFPQWKMRHWKMFFEILLQDIW